MNQEPGWAWGSSDRSKRWLLDEAGSYGYLVKAKLDKAAIRKAVETGKVIVRLQVDESGPHRAVYLFMAKNPEDFLLIRQ